MSVRDVTWQAADWVIKSDVPGFPERAAFLSWRDADPAHAAAFERARRLWQAMAGPSALYSFVEPVPEPVNDRAPAARWLIVGSIAASIAVTVGLGMFTDTIGLMGADIKTEVAAQASRRLADGSHLDLDSDTAVDIEFSAGERRLRLRKGQIYVDAAPIGQSEQRPFVIEAANGETRALGTRFNVNRLVGSVEVTAIHHRIAIHAEDASSVARSSVIGPGQMVRYDKDGRLTRHDTSAGLATAWREDKLILDRVSLRDACAILGRHSTRPIRLWARGATDYKISGVFDANDVERALHLIASQHRLRVMKLPVLGLLLV